MEFILFCIGTVVGGIVIYLDVEAERKMNKRLMKVINNLEDDLDKAIAKNKQYEEERSKECK